MTATKCSISRVVLALAACGQIFSPSARADEVHLIGGAKLDGKVSRQGDKVVIEVESGQLRVEAASVQRIERKTSALEHADALARRLGPRDVSGLLALADYCRDNALPGRERASLERILELEPDHARARDRLGYVKRDGRWLSHAEQLQAQGYVRESGRWVSPAERAELERLRAARASAELERERARLELAQKQVELERAKLEQAQVAQAQREAGQPYWWGGYPAYAAPAWLVPERACLRHDCDARRARAGQPSPHPAAAPTPTPPGARGPEAAEPPPREMRTSTLTRMTQPRSQRSTD